MKEIDVTIYQNITCIADTFEIPHNLIINLDQTSLPYLKGVAQSFYFQKNLLWLTAQKMKFSIKGFFSKGDQIRNFLRILSHLRKKSLMENFIFRAATHTSNYWFNEGKVKETLLKVIIVYV